jgi:hypothetical protein
VSHDSKVAAQPKIFDKKMIQSWAQCHHFKIFSLEIGQKWEFFAQNTASLFKT